MTKHTNFHKILVIGPGPVMIGQGSELDAAATQTCLALKNEGYQVVMVNSNPATVTTDKTIADIVYIEPLTEQFLAQILRCELPDAIIPMVGGQVGLDLMVKLIDSGIIDELQITILGISADSLHKIRNHSLLKELTEELNIPTPASQTVASWHEAQQFINAEMFPLFVHSESSVAGKGNYLATSDRHLKNIVKNGLAVSPVHQVTLEQSMAGKKEVHLNLLRDVDGNTIVISSSEDIEPVGIHTGDSISIIPVQTISDQLFQKMRTDAIRLLDKLMIVGSVAIRFAVDTTNGTYDVMNILLGASRTNILAEKATGYPLAWVAAKLMVGLRLDQIDLPTLKNCRAVFEPALDYVVAKVPRFSTKQFENSTRYLDMQMKATGESIGFGRNLLMAIFHAIQGLEIMPDIHDEIVSLNDDELVRCLKYPQDDYWKCLLEALHRGWSITEVAQLTHVDRFYLAKFAEAVNEIEQLQFHQRDLATFAVAKRYGLSNALIARAWDMSLTALYAWQSKKHLYPSFKPIEPTAGAWEIATANYYSAYDVVNENQPVTQNSILVLGAGPAYIGQGGELDNELTHTLIALHQAGYQPILINNNPNAVSVSWNWHAKTYLMPITMENVLDVINFEKPLGVMTQFAGKNGERLAAQLMQQGINVLGMNSTAFDKIHSDQKNAFLDQLKIMHPQQMQVTKCADLATKVHSIDFPVFIQPVDHNASHITTVLYNDADLHDYLYRYKQYNDQWQPVNISRYLVGIECESEAISDGQNVVIPGIIEHIERSGVLANDSMAVYPPQRLSHRARIIIKQYTTRLAQALQYRGILHVRFIVVGEAVYLIKIMMRASKSLPFLSKATNKPLAAWAVRAMVNPSEFSEHKDDWTKNTSNLISIKAPVFSYIRLSEDTALSTPSVKATGEVMGNDATLEKALYKAFTASQMPLPDHGVVLMTVADRDKMATIKLAKRFRNLGYRLWATPGTAAYLAKEVEVTTVQKVHQLHSKLLNNIAAERVQIIVNTLSIKPDSILDSLWIREVAVEHNIPLLTSLETTGALLQVLESRAFITRPR